MRSIPCFSWLSIWLSCVAVSLAVGEFAVDPSGDPQELPDIDGSTIVWQEYVSAFGDYDILGRDLESAAGALYIVERQNDQLNPRIDGGYVVWQDDYYGDATDWDIHISAITDPSAIVNYPVAATPDVSETDPAIHGDLVAFQQQYTDPDTGAVDWDIWAADIVDPEAVRLYPVTLWEENQIRPAVWRSDVVFSDYYVWPDTSEASWDITLADTWLKNDPAFLYPAYEPEDESAPVIDRDWIVYQHDYSHDGTDYDIIAVDRSDPRIFVTVSVANSTSSEAAPDLSGHIVVWQDNRHGNWDIYGYNLTTRKEFQITADPADQTNPAISGDTVVWEDMRSGVATIYAVYLNPADIAASPTPLPGDTDKNGTVNLLDFLTLAENWLACNLEPIDACINLQ
jgi:beta propeller repeat protein